MQPHNLVALVTLLSLALLLWTLVRVSLARTRLGVAAPATTGHPEFERHFRVQMNTLEGVVIQLPSMWLFALYWSDLIAAVLGVVWILGRVLYILAYVKEPRGRALGFLVQGVATLLLWAGALLGVARALIITGGV